MLSRMKEYHDMCYNLANFVKRVLYSFYRELLNLLQDMGLFEHWCVILGVRTVSEELQLETMVKPRHQLGKAAKNTPITGYPLGLRDCHQSNFMIEWYTRSIIQIDRRW